MVIMPDRHCILLIKLILENKNRNNDLFLYLIDM